MTHELMLHCNRAPYDSLCIDPCYGREVVVQINEDGRWAQVVLTPEDARRMAEHILMHVPLEQTNEH